MLLPEFEIAYRAKMNATSKTRCSLPLIFLIPIFAILSLARTAAAGAGLATFARTDATTQGNWQGVYGANGYTVVGGSQLAPSYATLTVQGESTWTWAPSTTDPRALETGSGSGRVAATWYSNPTFSIGVNITDGDIHQFALYAVDWDSKGRAETIQVVDATTGTVLDTRTLSSFTNGIYCVWNISGNVKFTVTATAGPNAVVSGVFFDVAADTSTTAQFVATDTSTQGSWQGAYGTDGYTVVGGNQVTPSYATLSVQSESTWTWAPTTTDPRALETGSSSGRVAATWYSNPAFSIDVNITDGNTHRFALYAVDWDSKGRAETIQVVDGISGTVLDTRTLSSFTNGIYYIWDVSGNVKFNITATAGPNAVVSGAFFDPATPSSTTARFIAADASTQGNWQANYGADGYTVVGGNQITPSYAAPTVQNGSIWTWAASSTDPRALETGSSSARVAAAWYNDSSFSIDVNVTDGNTHQIALYGLDWDSKGRAETIQVVNAQTKAVLSTQSISSFTNGTYLVWNISGHVTFNVTATSAPNAVISGIFFGGPTTTTGDPTPTPTPTPAPPAPAPSQGQLSVSPSSFNFGNVNVGSSVTQTFAVSNSGAGTVTISNATLAGAGLTASGVSSGTMLSSGQSVTLTVTYAPASVVALNGNVTFTSNASDPSVVLTLTGAGVQPPAAGQNAATFLGIDTTTQGAWKGIGNFNAPPATSSLVYGKDGDILPDTEGCDTACNPFPSYVSFGPDFVSSSTPGDVGSKPNSTHAYVDMVQGAASVMGPEPENTTNTNFFQCNYTNGNAAAPWALMVAWRPVTDTREISEWYTCAGITSFYMEFSFGASTHNFEIYVVDDQNGGTLLRSEEIEVLDGDTGAVLYDSGSFTNFTGGIYYRWSITGHVKIKCINTSTNGTNAVINGAFFN
jgi:hypothetical protein